MERKAASLGLFLLALGLWVWPLSLAASPAPEEVLRAVYPGARWRVEQLFLSPDQLKKVADLAGSEMSSPLLVRYRVSRQGKTVGRAYLETHVVRTKRETLLICLGARGRILRLEATTFLEPPEYRAPAAWLRQYRGKELTDRLKIGRDIHPLAGATLTARAVERAARRILALDVILEAGER